MGKRMQIVAALILFPPVATLVVGVTYWVASMFLPETGAGFLTAMLGALMVLGAGTGIAVLAEGEP